MFTFLGLCMSLLCNCPAGAALENIPISDCPESLGLLVSVDFGWRCVVNEGLGEMFT